MTELSLEQVMGRVLEIAKQTAPGAAQIAPESSLIRDLALDSLQALELVSDVETEFGVTFPSEALPEIDSLADVAKLVLELRRERAE